MRTYWIAVISHEHARKAIEEGMLQVCHGKYGPLSRLKKGDGVIIYSPKEEFLGKDACQKFTALGEVMDDEVYQFDMGAGFQPFRRRARYEGTFPGVSIKGLIDSLSFIKNKSSWGMAFRYGLIKVPEEDFLLIKKQLALR